MRRSTNEKITVDDDLKKTTVKGHGLNRDGPSEHFGGDLIAHGLNRGLIIDTVRIDSAREIKIVEQLNIK